MTAQAIEPTVGPGDRKNTIRSLPSELTDNVARYLDETDLLNIRRTCRDLCNKTNLAFADRFFRVVDIVLDTKGLDELQAIARHEKYRRGVQELILFTGHEGRRSLMSAGLDPEEKITIRHLNVNGCGELEDVLLPVPQKENASRRRAARREFRKRQHEINALSKPKLCGKALAAVYDRFPRLAKIAISSTVDLREHRRAEYQEKDICGHCIQLVYTVLTSLQLSRQKIRKFEMDCPRGFGQGKRLVNALSDDALIRRFGNGIIDTLSSLGSLTVRPVCHLERFAAVFSISGLFPFVTELHIKGNTDISNLTRSISAGAPLTSVKMHSKLHFPALQSIVFENFACRSNEVTSVLTKHKETLRKVKILEVHLLDVGPGPHDLFTTIIGLPKLQEFSLFKLILRVHFRQIEELTAMCLLFPAPDNEGWLFGSYESIRDRFEDIISRQYIAGEYMRTVLKSIQYQAYMQRLARGF